MLPLYLEERATPAAHAALLRDFGQLVTSVITLVELRSGLARYQRDSTLTSAQAEKVFARAEHDLDQTPRRLELTQDVLTEALRLLKAHALEPIRTLDLLHIATCLRYGTAGFVTGDIQQAKLAERVGLTVERLSFPPEGSNYE